MSNKQNFGLCTYTSDPDCECCAARHNLKTMRIANTAKYKRRCMGIINATDCIALVYLMQKAGGFISGCVTPRFFAAHVLYITQQFRSDCCLRNTCTRAQQPRNGPTNETKRKKKEKIKQTKKKDKVLKKKMYKFYGQFFCWYVMRVVYVDGGASHIQGMCFVI